MSTLHRTATLAFAALLSLGLASCASTKDKDGMDAPPTAPAEPTPGEPAPASPAEQSMPPASTDADATPPTDAAPPVPPTGTP